METWIEGRKNRAIELYQSGNYRQKDLAFFFKVSQGRVSQWCTEAKNPKELQKRGPKFALTEEQMNQLKVFLIQKPSDFGLGGVFWQRKEIQKLILEKFQVHFHLSTISKLMAKIGFTRQKPVKIYSGQDPEALRKWQEETMIEVKKNVC